MTEREHHIRIRLDRLLLDQQRQLTQVADEIGITYANLSNLKTGKVKAIRLSTLSALCAALNCQPGDLLEYIPPD